jgi:lipopolysaccharide export system protein LptC
MNARAGVGGLPIWSARQWILGAFFVASGLLAWWQLKPAEEAPLTEGARARLPDYVVAGFSAVETDAAGKPSRRLIADELRQYVDEDVAELDQPRLTLYPTEGEPWRARADTGLVLSGGEEIRLEGAVELERDGNADMRSTRMQTELIRIWHERAFAETDREVLATSDADRLTATGMRLWYNDPVRIELDGRARIFLAPEQAEQP